MVSFCNQMASEVNLFLLMSYLSTKTSLFNAYCFIAIVFANLEICTTFSKIAIYNETQSMCIEEASFYSNMTQKSLLYEAIWFPNQTIFYYTIFIEIPCTLWEWILATCYVASGTSGFYRQLTSCCGHGTQYSKLPKSSSIK